MRPLVKIRATHTEQLLDPRWADSCHRYCVSPSHGQLLLLSHLPHGGWSSPEVSLHLSASPSPPSLSNATHSHSRSHHRSCPQGPPSWALCCRVHLEDPQGLRADISNTATFPTCSCPGDSAG